MMCTLVGMQLSHVMSLPNVRVYAYLLGCTGWQELDSVSLVSRDATRQEDGVLLGIIGHEGDQALNLVYCESMFGAPLAVAMSPSC